MRISRNFRALFTKTLKNCAWKLIGPASLKRVRQCEHQVMSAATEDGAAGKNFETQGGWLFVSLERWINGALELAQRAEVGPIARWREEPNNA